MAQHEAYIRQHLAKYQYKNLVMRDSLNLIQVYRDLRPKMDFYVFNDGTRKELLSFEGTIPVTYRGGTYNIPVCFWLINTHPYNAPMVFVKPTSEMLVKPSKHVDANGRVYLPYLHEWRHPSSDLISLIQVLCVVFGENSPVYCRRGDPSIQPYPSRQTTNSLPSPSTSGSLTSRMSNGMKLEFNNVSVKIKDKFILNKVSGIAKPGQVVALMGPSGSGKTTLLNVLGGRHTDLVNGSILLDGEVLNKRLRRKICYVLQEDIFFENLTLREQLVYTARLKLPSAAPYAVKLQKVDEIVELLDIKNCLDTRIGSLEAKGLSGGEKKRANIGCELMTDPALLLLDEPTSGLDSFTAHKLMCLLKDFVKKSQKTLLVSVHQPSSQMFYMFDSLLLLHEGETVYFGEAPKVVDYFSSVGFPCDKQYNPADFILEKVRSTEEEVKTIMDNSRNASWEALKHMTVVENSDTGYNGVAHMGSELTTVNTEEGPKWQTTYMEQFVILTSRSFKESRKKLISGVAVAETLCYCLIMSMLWFQMGHTEDMINERAGAIFFALCIWSFVSMFLALQFFPGERVVINKERLSGLYRLSAYFLAKQTSEIPYILFLPLIGFTPIYWITGMNYWPPGFFISLTVLMLGAMLGQSIGMLFGLLFDDLGNGMVFLGMLCMYSLVAAGFYIKAFPFWLQWTKYLSFLYYVYQTMMTVEFTNNKPFICNMEWSNYEECAAYNGTNVVEIAPESILDFYNIELPIWFNICVLVFTSIIFRLLTYILLRYYRKPK
ncbi:uncharacterized protein LOC144451699 [Glandiceps talaboti]